jgi:hypothetical protein
MVDTVVFLTTADTSPWTVPADWNNAANTIECIGGGGGGGGGRNAACVISGGGGGAGGGYAKVSNLTLSGTAAFQVGIAGTAGAANGNGGAGGIRSLARRRPLRALAEASARRLVVAVQAAPQARMSGPRPLPAALAAHEPQRAIPVAAAVRVERTVRVIQAGPVRPIQTADRVMPDRAARAVRPPAALDRSVLNTTHRMVLAAAALAVPLAVMA